MLNPRSPTADEGIREKDAAAVRSDAQNTASNLFLLSHLFKAQKDETIVEEQGGEEEKEEEGGGGGQETGRTDITTTSTSTTLTESVSTPEVGATVTEPQRVFAALAHPLAPLRSPSSLGMPLLTSISLTNSGSGGLHPPASPRAYTGSGGGGGGGAGFGPLPPPAPLSPSARLTSNPSSGGNATYNNSNSRFATSQGMSMSMGGGGSSSSTGLPFASSGSYLSLSMAGGMPSAVPIYLPTRVGGDKVQWVEVDVGSEEAFQRISFGSDTLNEEQQAACDLLCTARLLREKHFTCKKPDYYWGAYSRESPQSPVQQHQSSHHHKSASMASMTEKGSSSSSSSNTSAKQSTSFSLGPSAVSTSTTTNTSVGSVGVAAGAGAAGTTTDGTGLGTAASSASCFDPSSSRARGGAPSISPSSLLNISAAAGSSSSIMAGSSSNTTNTRSKNVYRRTVAPKFDPFKIPILPKLEGITIHVVDGVAQVLATPEAALVLNANEPTPNAAAATAGSTTATTTTPTKPSTSTSSASPTLGLDVDGLATADNSTTTSDASSSSSSQLNLYPMPSWKEWIADYETLINIIHTPGVKTFAFRRLELLEARFQLHVQLNAEREIQEQKIVPHRDFYNVRKCDTHVHHSASMNQKHLLRFIKTKLKMEPNTVVINRNGKDLTLAQVFDSLNLSAYDLSIDTLDMHADMTTFQRFDRFNKKYNPVGTSRLRDIFLKTDNMVGGRFLAEITRELFEDLHENKYQLSEYRLSIYGRAKNEWKKLAAWVVGNNLASPQVRWMIQIPRLYEVYKSAGSIQCFQDMLENIFVPLFEVTIDPSVDPVLHQFLSIVSGIDSVDDESRPEPGGSGGSGADELPLPKAYKRAHQPPYHYWTFFLAQNIAKLNRLRASRGLTQFSFRPHCGEAGGVEHLAAAFLTAEGINHGINLRHSPALQYLYYVSQIGLAMSPLSNNRLFLTYTKNPFPEFFARGLNVSLSTDDPLMLAYTKEPLLEEYAVAAQVWHLNSADMCEIARNSVLQSGWEYPHKAHFLGPQYAEAGPEGNNVHHTNVPHIRLQYRLETLCREVYLLSDGKLLYDATLAAASGGGGGGEADGWIGSRAVAVNASSRGGGAAAAAVVVGKK